MNALTKRNKKKSKTQPNRKSQTAPPPNEHTRSIVWEYEDILAEDNGNVHSIARVQP